MRQYQDKYVLIVDDNPFNRTLLRSLLEQKGFSIVEAKNGRQAMKVVSVHSYAYIFLDLIMPGMDGFETLRRMRQIDPTTPIVIVSVMESQQTLRKCLELGANAFIEKPVTPESLWDLLDRFENEPELRHPIKGKTNKKEQPWKSRDFSPSECPILFVEPDPDLSKELCEFLTRLGFPVFPMANGSDAWNRFISSKHAYRIIVSNMFTPDIDGPGLVAKVRLESPETPVLIYGRENDPEAFQLVTQVGGAGVIPLDKFKESILDMIRSAYFQIGPSQTMVRAAYTASQVRKAQKRLIRFGCDSACDDIDIAYSSLTDAGGDLARCQRFNRAGLCGIFLADVAGHDVLSSYISAISLGVLSSSWAARKDPWKLILKINSELNKPEYDGYHLCTSAILWDRRRGHIQNAITGNPGAIRLSPENPDGCTIDELPGGGMCLGLLPENHLFVKTDYDLHPNQWLFLFTDGIESHEILDLIRSGTIDLHRDSPKGLAKEILEHIQIRREPTDDMMLVVLKAPDRFPSQGYHYQFQSTYAGVDEACQWFSQLSSEYGVIDADFLCFLLIAIREALVNAVMHGNRLDPKKFVDLSVFPMESGIRVEVSDQGTGIVGLEAIPTLDRVDVLNLKGKGLPAIKSLADKVEADGSTLIMIFSGKIQGSQCLDG